jgi:nitrate/TMAO reductase-like tetraheme cytochrome c subunit
MRIAVIVVAALMLMAASARAQTSTSSSCAGCHYANPTAPAPEHLSDWEHSAHGRENVGCESCHGGDASTFESFLAHRGLLTSSNPASPVHRRNLPATCGRCHTGPFVRFQSSDHYALLQKGDKQVPTCTTCHDSVGSRLPSAKALEGNCQQCHGPKGIAPRVERASAARTLLEEVRESRELLEAAEPFIDRLKDKTRQAKLRYAYEQAEVPLIEAGRSMHEFQFTNLKERLATARRRIEDLLGELANP